MEMKAKIKALKGKTVRLFWHKNGYPHDAVGVIKEVKIVQFTFKINGNLLIKVRFENATNVEEI